MHKLKNIIDGSLYLITGEEYSRGQSTLEVVQEVVNSGVDIVQMREKAKSRQELLELGRKIAFLCNKENVIFIVNDDPYLAAEVGADGVHLGQEDITHYPLKEARSILGKEKIIGLSTHSVKQFEQANESDADYIAFGPIFPTKTKNYHIGTGSISEVSERSEKPVVFVGGITEENMDEVLSLGGRNIAMIRALVQNEDIQSAVKNIKLKIKKRIKR